MIINGNATDPNKLLPFTYSWAWDHYKTGQNNHWLPSEVGMTEDIELWKATENNQKFLTEEERKVIIYNLGFFSTAESLTGNNLVLSIYKHITNPEIRMALGRQFFEELVHSETFVYICDSLGLDPDYIYNMYKTIPSIKKKDDFVVKFTKSIMDGNFNTNGKENIQKFLLDLVAFYLVMEGIMFYGGFCAILSLKKRNKMVGLGEQFEFILRDESNHLAIGIDIINTIKKENPEIWENSFKEEIYSVIKEGVSLEKDYVKDIIPNGFLGIKPETYNQYIEYLADRRLVSIGLDKIYNKDNPFPWIDGIAIPVESNFFERKVKEYSMGMLEW